MDKEQLKKLISFCKEHEISGRQSFLGAMYDNEKASIIASKLGLYGIHTAQYKMPNGNTMIYIDGLPKVEFGK